MVIKSQSIGIHSFGYLVLMGNMKSRFLIYVTNSEQKGKQSTAMGRKI
jgi:hypothetical protein